MNTITSKFWHKINNCNHEISDSYYESLECGTPYCVGEETLCKKCGAYMIKCGCGSMNGLSGWSDKRRETYKRETYKRGRIK